MRFIITNRQRHGDDWAVDRNPEGLSFWVCQSFTWGDSRNWSEVTGPAFTALLKGIGKPVIFFIHGFNNSWSSAEGTVSAIQDNLPEAQVVLFSWISGGQILEYEQDRARARESATDLLNALLLLKPHVIAHSMGNYLLQLAFSDADSNFLLVDKLAMVAADVDNNVLETTQAIARMTNRGLVFHCAIDGALQDSTLLHAAELNGLPRLGLTGPFGHVPANFTALDCTKELESLKDIGDPWRAHSQYFQEKFFYDAMRELLGIQAQSAGAP